MTFTGFLSNIIQSTKGSSTKNKKRPKTALGNKSKKGGLQMNQYLNNTSLFS